MDRKTIMGIAAVAGIGFLLYMRKSGANAAIGSSASMLGAASGASNWASAPIVINTTKPLTVDNSATKPAPAPAPAQVATFGGGGGSPVAAPTSTVDANGLRTYSDGSTYQMTDSERYMYQLNTQQGGFKPWA